MGGLPSLVKPGQALDLSGLFPGQILRFRTILGEIEEGRFFGLGVADDEFQVSVSHGPVRAVLEIAVDGRAAIV